MSCARMTVLLSVFQAEKTFSQFDISNFSHSFPILHSMSSDSRIKTFSFQLYSKTYGTYLLLCLCRMDGLWKTFEPRDQHHYSFERQVPLTKSKEVEIVCQVSEKRVIWIRLKLHGFPLTFSLEQSPNFPYSDVKKLKSITHKQLQQNIYNSKNSFVPLIHFFLFFSSLRLDKRFFSQISINREKAFLKLSKDLAEDLWRLICLHK